MTAILLPTTNKKARNRLVDRRLAYVLPSGEMAQGSTLGAPRTCLVCKPTGAIAKVYSSDAGFDFFGAIQLHFWDRLSGIRLRKGKGKFHLHPERQDHIYTLSNGVDIQESVFAYNRLWSTPADIPPGAVYYTATIRNTSDSAVNFDAYFFAELRGNTSPDVLASFDQELQGIVAWNSSKPQFTRFLTLGEAPDSWAVHNDRASVVSATAPAALSNTVEGGSTEPIAVLHRRLDLAPGEEALLTLTCVLSPQGPDRLAELRRSCPDGVTASKQTSEYYWSALERSIVVTPDPDVNNGSIWAKANMLRVQTYAPTGWCFTNDPTRSNNSVGRDTAWYSYGCDYLSPAFSRDSLSAYFRLQESNGKIVEYYDIRNGKTADYDLNVNDNTPLMVIALAHHFALTGDHDFLKEYFPAACRAMEYLLTQRNEMGLIWCTSTKTQDWGIVGWRNVIDGYRISGASTEVNVETVFAFASLVTMAEALGRPELVHRYTAEGDALRAAIEKHLVNPENDLYYLAIDVDGTRRTEVTADLIFPVLFEVAPPARAAKIISVLSDSAFWTDVGIRTIPRDDLSYGPTNGYGLLGGVWVALTYWYAFAAAKYDPQFMAHALSKSFHHFSDDPRRNNSVPGQFSEWLHGETLVNQGMMLSPWDAPRYLWATIEGAAGLHVSGATVKIDPHLARDWRWLAAANVPYRGKNIAWLAVRIPEIEVFTTSDLAVSVPATRYTEDITPLLCAEDEAAVTLGFANDQRHLLFLGNTGDRTLTTVINIDAVLHGTRSIRIFTTVLNEWETRPEVDAAALAKGIPVVVDAGGFVLIELTSS